MCTSARIGRRAALALAFRGILVLRGFAPRLAPAVQGQGSIGRLLTVFKQRLLPWEAEIYQALPDIGVGKLIVTRLGSVSYLELSRRQFEEAHPSAGARDARQPDRNEDW